MSGRGLTTDQTGGVQLGVASLRVMLFEFARLVRHPELVA